MFASNTNRPSSFEVKVEEPFGDLPGEQPGDVEFFLCLCEGQAVRGSDRSLLIQAMTATVVTLLGVFSVLRSARSQRCRGNYNQRNHRRNQRSHRQWISSNGQLQQTTTVFNQYWPDPPIYSLARESCTKGRKRKPPGRTRRRVRTALFESIVRVKRTGNRFD